MRELVPVERRIQRTQQSPLEVDFAVPGMDVHVDSLRLDPANLLDWKEPQPIGFLQHNAAQQSDRNSRWTTIPLPPAGPSGPVALAADQSRASGSS